MAAFDTVQRLDDRVMQGLADHRTTQLDWIARRAMDFGRPSVMFFVGSLVVAVLAWTRRWAACAAIAIAALAATVTTDGLKLIFERDRPPPSLALVYASGYAFPSSAACLTIAVIAVLVILVAWPIPKLRVPAVAVATVVVFVSGWAVMYLGAHWLTDVLAGWLIGLLIAAGACAAAPIAVDLAGRILQRDRA